MTTLQDAARKALMALQEARTRLQWFVDSYPYDVIDKKNFFNGTVEAIESLRTTLAQQGEQPTCPKCRAELLYECVACSHANYPKKSDMKPGPRQMTDAEIIAIAVDTMSAEPGRDGYVLPVTFVRAILEKVGAA